VALRDSYFAAGRLLREGGLDPLVRGLWAQAADARGRAHGGPGSYADGARQSFLGRNGRGLDLAAIDLQRGRDHGLPGYNAVRAALGLPRVASFEQIARGGAGDASNATAAWGSAAAAERAAARTLPAFRESHFHSARRNPAPNPAHRRRNTASVAARERARWGEVKLTWPTSKQPCAPSRRMRARVPTGP
jgi:hypothetical protein